MIRSKVRVAILLVPLVSALLFILTAGRFGSNERAKAAWSPQGTVYYVAPTGDDSNLGTADQPWRTIQKAANTLVAGDTVYIRAGMYAEQVTPQNSGSTGNTIIYAAYPGETATIDGSGVTLPDDLAGLFEISNVSAMAISPSGDVFAGTGCGGIWRRSAGLTRTVYLPLVLKN